MQLSETQIIFLKPEYESWEKFAREYIENFILNHDIYRHIPSDVPWDLSGSVSLVKNNLVNYISKQEVDFYND